MANLLVKICGITTVEIALAAISSGADYIGLVFHAPSPRNVNMAKARVMAQAILNAGATPVAVFMEQSAVEMQNICAATQIQVVQLHGAARAQHQLLPTTYQRFYVTVPQDLDPHMASLDVERDFVMLDHCIPGQGKTLDWRQIHFSASYRWFLAGGLTPANVATALSMLQPHGVDVSSGVETNLGKKSVDLIREFIKVARGAQ